jgi:hypothetical protein
VATLGDRLAERDAERFVGRARELAFLEDLLGGGSPAAVVLVHGPGGIGKSTLLRELARRGAARGRTVRLVEGRELAPAPGELERALDGVAAAPAPLVLFDTYERLTALGGWLRGRLLPALPADALVVLAGRRPPEADWFQGGWERVVVELELGPFGDADARRLAGVHGVEDEATVRRLVEWAEGSPLALALGADAARGGGWTPERLEGRPDLVRAILRRLGEAELEGADQDVLDVAAVARTVSAALLREVLPDVDADEAEAWLRSRTFAERVGGAVALHDLVRRALRADLRRRAPERERELRRRVADHLHDRAARGEPRLIADLADLVEAPAVRWGMGAEGSVRHRVDGLRDGDLDVLRTLSRERIPDSTEEDFAAWWTPTAALLSAAADRAVVVRDAADRLAGLAFAVTPFNAPAAAEADRQLGPWLAHAREHAPGGRALLWRDCIDFTSAREGDLASPVLGLMNTAVVLRSGLGNPRWSYLPIDPGNAAARAFAEGVGATHAAGLDVRWEGGRGLECWILDSGPGGMLGGFRAAVYAELGLAPPAPADPPPPAAAGAPITAGDVRDALRNLEQPLELASSPLARGTTPEERAASVRAALEAAAAGAFGDSPDEALLRDVLRRGYLDGQGGHEAAWYDLHLSRATYFRRLRTASARVADWLIAAGSAGYDR